MEPTLSFSIINILGTETNNGELRKGSTLSSAMKKANASSSPPSDCPPYEHELHPHDTLEGIIMHVHNYIQCNVLAQEVISSAFV